MYKCKECGSTDLVRRSWSSVNEKKFKEWQEWYDGGTDDDSLEFLDLEIACENCGTLGLGDVEKTK